MRNILPVILAAVLVVGCNMTEVKQLTIVPYPNEVELGTGAFNVQGAELHYDTDFKGYTADAIKAFAAQLSMTTGEECRISEGESKSGFVFRFDPELPEEAYRLNVSRKAAIIEASTLNGVIYAIQTIKQMLPDAIYGNTAMADAGWTMQCCKIQDEPRFGYRGALLDEGR